MKVFVYLALVPILATAKAASYRRFVDYIIYGQDVEGFCEQCEDVLELLKRDPYGTLQSAVEKCKEFKYFTDRICDEEYRLNADTIASIMQNLKAPISEACKFLGKGGCGEPQSSYYKWTIDVDKIAPDSSYPPRHFVPVEPEWKSTHLSMLQVSDTHLDHDYEVGAEINCDEPVCCTKYQKQATDPKNFAGPWGVPFGKACNIPLRTLENLFHDIERQHHISFAIWTGDYTPHNLLGMSYNRTIQDLAESTAIIKRYLRNIKVFPALGNHDTFPSRMFPTPEMSATNFSTRPLYDEMWSLWYEWLPADQEDNFKLGGYYTAKVTDKLRIVSLNTNFCYSANLWLVVNSNDPGGQLSWLIRVLDLARRNRERVFIIGHVPPGSETCLPSWEEAYFKIVSKFNMTIAGQFFGHVHTDGIILDYGDEANPEVPTSVVYATPAATTSWSGMPEYRIYQTEMGEVVDVETYFLNLTTANAGYASLRESIHHTVREDLKTIGPFDRTAMEKILYGEPEWELGYSARKSYGLRKFDAQHWHKFVKQIEEDDNLLQKVYKHHLQFREDSGEGIHCDAECKKRFIESMSSKRSLRRKSAAP